MPRSTIAQLEQQIADARAELIEHKKRKRVQCEKCKRRSTVSTLTYIQTHWYVQPYSCTGGDYWKQGEGQFVCPKCDHTNRLYNRPDVVALKMYFRDISKTYDDR